MLVQQKGIEGDQVHLLTLQILEIFSTNCIVRRNIRFIFRLLIDA